MTKMLKRILPALLIAAGIIALLTGFHQTQTRSSPVIVVTAPDETPEAYVPARGLRPAKQSFANVVKQMSVKQQAVSSSEVQR